VGCLNGPCNTLTKHASTKDARCPCDIPTIRPEAVLYFLQELSQILAQYVSGYEGAQSTKFDVPLLALIKSVRRCILGQLLGFSGSQTGGLEVSLETSKDGDSFGY